MNEAEYFFKEGVKFYDAGDYNSAIAFFLKVIEKDENYAPPEYNLGVLYAKLGKNDEAEKHFLNAIKKDENDARSEDRLGALYYNLGRTEEAERHFSEAIKKDENDAVPEYNLGVLYDKLGKNAEAEKHFLNAIKRDENDARSENNLGSLYYNLGRTDEAEKHYLEAIKKGENNALPENNLGVVYAKLNKNDEAEKYFLEAIRKDKHFATPENNLGNLYAKLGKSGEAGKHYLKAIEKDPKYGSPYLGLGLLDKYSDRPYLTSLYLTKYLYLETERIEKLSDILEFYKEYLGLPYVAKLIQEKLRLVDLPNAYIDFFVKSREQCELIDTYLQYLKYTQINEENELNYKRLLASVNYFMGNYPEAFRIYDEEVDQPEGMLLADQYYFLLSAIASLAPENEYNAILGNALQDAESFAENFDGNHQSLSELYYAGLVFFHAWETSKNKSYLESSVRYFAKADKLVYLPAAYMHVKTLELLGKPEEVEKQRERVKKYEINLGSEIGFSRGFQRRILDSESGDFLTPFRHFAHFKEIQEVIIENYGNNLSFPELYEAFTLHDLQALRSEVYRQNIKELRKELLEQFEQELNKERSTEKAESIKKELKKLYWDIKREFEYFDERVQQEANELEENIALYIHSWNIPKAVKAVVKSRKVYEKLIQYFAMRGSISVVSAWTLLYYVYYIEEKHKPRTLRRLFTSAFLEGESDILKELLSEVGKDWIKTLITIGALQVSPLTFFASLCVRFIIEKQAAFFEVQTQNLPGGQDYVSFKQVFEENVVENILRYRNEGMYQDDFIKQIEKWR